MKRLKPVLLLLGLALILSACAPAATPTPAPSATPEPSATVPTATSVPPTITSTPLPPTLTFTPPPSATPSDTPTPLPSETPTQTPVPTATETLGEMLKNHIVFYLMLPEKGRVDACGNATAEPIISKRIRTGDKLKDVQIALNMLFSVGVRRYGVYYNGLWDTRLQVNTFKYIKQKDYAIIDFAGYWPHTQVSDCDKHAIRDQVWETFYHYGFKEKTFTINGHYMIDQLGGK
jgi:hypothetical protein